MSATKADVYRWFNKREGCEVTTRQVRPDGMVWEPGVRVVMSKGTYRWTLDGSTVRLTREHVVLAVEESRVVLEWVDQDGTTIHITTYEDAHYDHDEGDDE